MSQETKDNERFSYMIVQCHATSGEWARVGSKELGRALKSGALGHHGSEVFHGGLGDVEMS